MAFGHFLLGSHNFMITALGSCKVAQVNYSRVGLVWPSRLSVDLYLFGVISEYFIPSSILLKLVVYTLKLIVLLNPYSLNNTTTLRHLSCY